MKTLQTDGTKKEKYHIFITQRQPLLTLFGSFLSEEKKRKRKKFTMPKIKTGGNRPELDFLPLTLLQTRVLLVPSALVSLGH